MRLGVGLACLLFFTASGIAQTIEPPKLDPKIDEKKDRAVSLSDEQILKEAGFKTDPPALIEFFQKRTLADAERERVQQLIKDLGNPVFRVRESASKELVGRGSVVLEMLREAMRNEPLAIAKRAEICLKRIMEKDVAIDVPLAAVRLLAKLKPKETVDTLFAYLPFADNEYIADEARSILSKLALEDGKPHPTLIAGLSDKLAVRRA